MKPSVSGLGLVAGIALLAGCAGIPDSGSVHVGRQVAAAGDGLADVSVREVPAGPLPGAGPVQQVSGFLRAMVDSDGDYSVARSYLTSGASWNTGSGITLYAEPARIDRSGSGAVTVRATRIGVIGPQGVYRVDPGRVVRRFAVARRGGQWRISKLEAGVLLSSDDASRLVEPANLYFLTPDGSRLVPQPVLAPPQDPGLATTLMRGLLQGPGPWLAPGVRTAVPRGTTLVGNVPISANGVAQVDLSAGARQISPPQLMRLSAQVVWTLRQLTSVTAVQLLANGTALDAPGIPALQSVHAWPQFDPAAPPAAGGALLVAAGRVAGIGTGVPPSLHGSGFTAAVTSSDGAAVAAVRLDGGQDELLVGGADGQLRVAMRGSAMTRPTFAPGGSVVVATTSGLFAVAGHGPARRIPLSGRLSGAVVRAISISRDGTRAALVIDRFGRDELDLATIAFNDGRMELRFPRLVLPATYDPAGVAWANADHLVTTVRVDAGRRGVLEVGANGYETQLLSTPGLPADVDQVTAAPSSPILAADATGTWQVSGGRWQSVADGTAPSYAGG